MEERFYIQVGNCFVAFIGLHQRPTMKADYHKADPFLTEKDAREEAKKRGIKDFKIVKRIL